MASNSSKLVKFSLAIVATIIAIMIWFLVTSNDSARFGGDDKIIGGDFTLNSVSGEVSLTDFKGKLVLMYFGFTDCPEVCPNSMSIITNALKKLDHDQVEQIQPILISIDPKRDTVEKLAEYTQFFHPSIIGITGTEEQIVDVTNNYGAHYEVIESNSVDSEYAFYHTSRYYIIDKEGELITAMRHSTTSNELAAKLKQLL